MRQGPPIFGRLVLRVLVPVQDHDFVAGDLGEEFSTCVVPIAGLAAARRWYVRQAVRSAWPFALLRLRRGRLASALLRALISFALPVALLHAFWRSVLSLVPLRAATLEPGAEAATALCVLLLAGVSGAMQGSCRRRSGGCPGVELAAAVLLYAVWLLPLLPWQHVEWLWLLAAGAPAAALAGGMLSRDGAAGTQPGRMR